MSDVIPKYQNESEKSQYFNIHKIDTQEELTDLIDKLSEKDLIFRGVHDSCYKLFSSYHRFLHESKGSNTFVEDEGSIAKSQIIGQQIEKIVSECGFQESYMQIADEYAAAHNGKYRMDTGNYRYLFHSLSKMQHYEAKTFLVDFSYDIYVGLLFSIFKYRDASYISLITFPYKNITNADMSDFPADIEHYAPRESVKMHIKDPDFIKARLYDVGIQMLQRPIILLIGGEEKYLRNPRQAKQKGCFLMYDPTDAGGIMNEGLESLINKDFFNPLNPANELFTSYEISANLIPHIKRILKAKKITPYRVGFNECLCKRCW